MQQRVNISFMLARQKENLDKAVENLEVGTDGWPFGSDGKSCWSLTRSAALRE